MRRKTIALAAVGLALAGPALAACGGAATKGSNDMTEVSKDTAGTILDVRDRTEWDAGHLEGARLLSFNTGEFAAALDTLDPNAAYTLYCRSGNRSGQAAAIMRDAGFTKVTDLGAMENAAEVLDIDIVRD